MIAPLWYQWRDGAFWVVGRKRSQWVHDLKVDPRAAVCIEEEAHPRIRKVLAQCVAEVVEGPVDGPGSQWLPVAEEMATRYIGPDGPEALAPSHTWQRFLVKLTPRDGRQFGMLDAVERAQQRGHNARIEFPLLRLLPHFQQRRFGPLRTRFDAEFAEGLRERDRSAPIARRERLRPPPRTLRSTPLMRKSGFIWWRLVIQNSKCTMQNAN